MKRILRDHTAIADHLSCTCIVFIGIEVYIIAGGKDLSFNTTELVTRNHVSSKVTYFESEQGMVFQDRFYCINMGYYLPQL